MNSEIPGRIAGAMDLSYLAEKGNNQAAQAATMGTNAQTIDLPAVVFAITDQTFENAAGLSSAVPVVMFITNGAAEEKQPQLEMLSKLVRGQAGKVVLGTVDADANPQLVSALQLQALPTAILLLGQRPEMLFQGAQTEENISKLLPQIVALAAQRSITGTVNAPDLDASGQTDISEQINPAHENALAAAETGDYATAIAEYKAVLAKNPRDEVAETALAQMQLLQRLEALTAAQIREQAAAAPDDVAAQMLVADLDVAGGHVEDAFLRLLEFYERAEPADKKAVQQRLIELFMVVGPTDQRVIAARRKLANLLY